MATICIFGDSITWGAVDPGCGGWATRLRNYFESIGERVDNDTDVYNLGVSGDNTEDLLVRFRTEMIARNPNLILFAVGINDSQFIISRNQNRVSVEKFKANIEKLIEEAREITEKIIIIGLTQVDESKTSPIPWNLDKRYTNVDIKKYDAVLRGLSSEKNIPYIDMSEVLNLDDLSDGLHPNSQGHIKMFEVIKRQLTTSVF